MSDRLELSEAILNSFKYHSAGLPSSTSLPDSVGKGYIGMSSLDSFSRIFPACTVNRDVPLKIQTLRKIITLARLKLPMIAFSVFCFGALLAVVSGATFAPDRFLLGSATMLAALLSVNYGNDYFDIDVDQHNRPTPISGGSGILLENPELRRFARLFAIFLRVVSIAFAIVFTILFTYPVLFVLFVASGNLISWFYSAPPLRLSYRGFGEIVTIIAVGLMTPGMGYFIMKASFDSALGVFAVPCALYALAFIVNVEIPDLEGDRIGNKKTLIVLEGRRFGFFVNAFLLSFATLYFLIISMANLLSPLVDFRLIALLSSLPLSTGLFGLIRRPEDRDSALTLASLNVASISLFLLLIDLYLTILLV
jgi:1,4-dihydroxy-2-naphthoate octaprenyltransferase